MAREGIPERESLKLGVIPVEIVCLGSGYGVKVVGLRRILRGPVGLIQRQTVWGKREVLLVLSEMEQERPTS